MGLARALLLITSMLASCVQYEPKNATFYNPRTSVAPSGKQAPVSTSKFEWRTTESDPGALFDKLAARAPAAGAVSSRMNGVFELSKGTTRLRVTQSANDLYFECWAPAQSDCNELLTDVLDTPEPVP